jgi:hypothetical protein
MNRRFFALLALIAVVTVPLAGVASAQNATDVPDPANSSAVELSKATTLADWRFTNGTMVLEVRSKVPTRLVVTDAGALSQALAEGSGSATGTVRMQGYNIGSGRTTIRFDATTIDGAAAVTISAAGGDGLAYVRTDAIGSGQPPVEWQTALMLVLGAGGTTAVLTYRRVKKKLEEKREEIRRIV